MGAFFLIMTNKTKIISIVLIIIVLLNFILFIFNKTNPYIFWSIIVIAALFAYKILPCLRTSKNFLIL
jgi:hypothetical protein